MAEVGGTEGTFRVEIDGPDGAPAILLSHALGADLTMWDAVAPILAKSFRVIRYDSRGHGGSIVVERPTSMDELGADALRILDACGVEKAHFLGLSMGGMVGQWLLAHAPHRLDRVILANTGAASPPASGWNARLSAIAANGLASLAEGVMERWFTEAFRKSEPETVARTAKIFVSTSPAGYASCCAAIRDMDQRWSVRSAVNETMVIVGARDASTTPQAGRALHAAIPGAQMASLDVAHLSCVEAPEAFADIVLKFLSAPKRVALKRPAAATGKRAVMPAPRKRAAKITLAARAAATRLPKLSAAQAALTLSKTSVTNKDAAAKAKASASRRKSSEALKADHEGLSRPSPAPSQKAVAKSGAKSKGKSVASGERKRLTQKSIGQKKSAAKLAAANSAAAKPTAAMADRAKGGPSQPQPATKTKPGKTTAKTLTQKKSLAQKKTPSKTPLDKSQKTKSPALAKRAAKTSDAPLAATSSLAPKGPPSGKSSAKAKPPRSGGTRGRPPRRTSPRR